MRKRQVTIGHQSCRVFVTSSLPGVHAAYHGCVHKALQTQSLSLNTMPLRPLPHPLDLGCQDSTLSLSTSFLFFLQQHTSHLPPTSLSAPLRLHLLLLLRLSPLLSPREPESGCLLALWTGDPCSTTMGSPPDLQGHSMTFVQPSAHILDRFSHVATWPAVSSLHRL